MAQFSALLYKNMKIIMRQWPTSLMQLLSPLICIGIVLVLQYIAKLQTDSMNLKPPFEIPFGGLYPVNIPYDLLDYRKFGIDSCLRNNKYAFSERATPEDKKFMSEYIGFSKISGIRNFVCVEGKHRATISPSFVPTGNATVEAINKEILDEMSHFYGTAIPEIASSMVPTDGFYLFSEASRNKISGTIFSNNFNFGYFHRSNGATQLRFGSFLVR